MANGKVTLHDLYEMTAFIREDIAELKACSNRNSERISALEIWRAEIVGKITVVVGVITIAFTTIYDWLKKKIFE